MKMNHIVMLGAALVVLVGNARIDAAVDSFLKDGMFYAAEGNAKLSLAPPNNQLVVETLNNIGDGFRVNLTDAEGWAGDLDFTGSMASWEALALGAANQVVAQSRFAISNSEPTLRVNFPWLTNPDLVLQVGDGRQIIESRHVLNDTSVSLAAFFPICASGEVRFVCRYVQRADLVWLRICWSLCPGPLTQSVERVICVLPPAQPPPTLPPPKVTAVSFFPSPAGTLRVGTSSMRALANDHTGLGISTLTASNGMLTVGNIGSSGQDGVAVSFRDLTDLLGQKVRGFEAVLWPSKFELGLGQELRASALGRFSGNDDSPIGWFSVRNLQGTLQMLADFAAIGSGSVRVEAYQGNVSVGSVTLPGGVLGQLSDGQGSRVPIRSYGVPLMNPAMGFLVTFPGAATFNPPNGQPLTGDRFHLLAAQASGSVQTLQEFHLRAMNLQSFTIESETVQTVGPPQLLCPSNLVVQCQGPNGTPFNYTPVPTNFSGSNITVVCSPPSGTAFGPGTRPVQCGATDEFGENATCSFTVTVLDTNPPLLVCPTNIVLNSLSSTGMVASYPTPGAVDNCDANVTVTCTPASGSLFPIGSTTVTCTAVDDANNAGSCSFEVKVNPPPPPIIAHGLTYRPLGQARLAVDANGELLVSNLGTTGYDGFRVELGAAEGWEGEVVSDPFGLGESLHATRVHAAFGGLLLEDRLSFSEQGLFASVDFSPVGVVTSLVEVVGQAVSSAERVANNQWVALQAFGANSPQLDRRTIRSQRTAWTLAWPSKVSYAFDYSDAEPDFFGLDPNAIDDEEDDLSIALPISAVDFFHQSVPAFRIRRASLRMFGQDHFALGEAMFHAQWPTLSLSNIGPSGLDGVLIPLPQVSAFAAELMPENLANTPAGAFLNFEATGTLGADNQPSYHGSLGSIRFVFAGQRLELSADFSAVGASGAIVEIYDGVALAATFNLGPNQSGFVWPSWPTRVGISPAYTAADIAPPVYEVWIGSRQQFMLPNQGAIMGDRAAIRPLGNMDRLSALDQVSLRVASRPLTILHETTDWQSWNAPVPSVYALWSASQWLPNSPESTKPDADPDEDGISSFVEYSLGLDPRTASRIGLPQVTFVPDGSNVFGALRLRVPIWAKDVRYRVWAADGLEEPVQWAPLDGIFDQAPVSRLHKEIIIRDLIPDRHQRFLKIDVEQVELSGGLVTEAPVLPTTGDPLRIGFYNAQFLTLGGRDGCCDDMPNRARRIGERIRATGFDIVALCEVFKSDAKDRLVDELSPTFPHFVRLLRGSPFFGGIPRQDSGLMLFSRHPFVSLPPTAAAFAPGVLEAVSVGMPWTSVAFTLFEACHGLLFRHGSDCLAQKGAGLVRIQNTNSGRIYNVVFTHMDAGGDGEDAAARASQLDQIEEMLRFVLGDALNSEDVFMLGDLNVNGQIFGDRAEWTRHFATAGGFFTDVLHDAWEEQTNLPELSPFVTGFEFRDQGLTSKIHAEGGARNRKDYLLINHPASLPPGRLPLRVQHMAIAFGLRDSLPTAFGPLGRFEPSAFGFAGRQDLSDHYGIIADINLEAASCSPQTSLNNPPLTVGAGPNVATVLRGTIVHVGGMHWYRFDQPGTYSIAVRSASFTNHVYDSRQLSLPVPNYRGESRTLVDSTGAGVTAQIFDVPESPLYIRVSHIHRTGSGNYELSIRRHEGNSPDDAIVLTPNNNTRPYRADFPPAPSGFPCRWFRLDTERADSGGRQNLEFYVASSFALGGTYQLSIVDGAVPRSSNCPPAGNILAGNSGVDGTQTATNLLGSEELFMVVQPPTSTVSFAAGWSTDLTVIHPYVPGYCPGSATATALTCRQTSLFPYPTPYRDVRMEISVRDRDSRDELHTVGPLPLLEIWGKGRNHNVEAELGTIRFLPSEEVRVRLLARDAGGDERLTAIISSLGRAVHRTCNGTIDLVGSRGGRYQLNFHVSHGVPALP